MTLDKTGSFILVASQDANKVEVFRIDHGTGLLTRTDTADAPCAADVAIA
jgi:6-phosphogluconolactonase